MKSIKRKFSRNNGKAIQALSLWIRPLASSIGNKMRLGPRIRLCNMWASKHPKKMAAYSIGMLFIIFISSLFPFGNDHSDTRISEEIVKVEPMFSKLRDIQTLKQYQNNQVNEMALHGKNIKNRLDSLISLPVKSKNDSLEIFRCYRQIQIIAQNLNSNDNEKN
mgnify:FL=1